MLEAKLLVRRQGSVALILTVRVALPLAKQTKKE